MADRGQLVTSAAPAPAAATAPRGLRLIIGLMVFAAVITVAYWVIWFGIDRSILALIWKTASIWYRAGRIPAR